MEFPNLIEWTSPFPFTGLLGGIFHFHLNSNKTSCKQTVENLIRRRDLRRLVCLCTVCRCPIKRTLGLYRVRELRYSEFLFRSINFALFRETGILIQNFGIRSKISEGYGILEIWVIGITAPQSNIVYHQARFSI